MLILQWIHTMNNLTSLFLALAAFLLSAGMNLASANIDPAHEWPIVKVAQGVYAREPAAVDISALSPTQRQQVIDLFHTHQPPKDGYGFSLATNGCYSLQILTEKSFEDFGVEETNFPDMKTQKGISVLEYFSTKRSCNAH
jgi:hypothetical protein